MVSLVSFTAFYSNTTGKRIRIPDVSAGLSLRGVQFSSNQRTANFSSNTKIIFSSGVKAFLTSVF